MTQEERFFGNPFSDPNITPLRLYLFGLALKTALAQDNPGGKFDGIIAYLDTKLQLLAAEIGDVSTALGQQKGSTITAKGVIAGFIKAMIDNEGFIARQLGGRTVPEYQEFYPQGKTEYDRANKTKMIDLTERVYDAADAHSAEIGTALADELKAFKADWVTAAQTQQTKIESVSDNRTERSAARIDVEIACLEGIHQVAAAFPGNVEKGSSYTPFHLLYPATHHTHTISSGNINAAGFAMAFNKSLTAGWKIKVTNLSDNADLGIKLMPTPIAPDGSMLKVKANKSKIFKAEQLGDLANTYMMIQNLSATNPLLWRAEIIQ